MFPYHRKVRAFEKGKWMKMVVRRTKRELNFRIFEVTLWSRVTASNLSCDLFCQPKVKLNY